ncbi:MAG: alkene reductase [Myxococcota bacterium]|jgi:N-ethylmaleimide reductase|nr:alkene reductase [Myxococcota bacterium]
MSSSLFESFPLGELVLKNRVVMAPMTRTRSPKNVPAEMVATYYAQRAEAGLIISEGTAPAPEGLGYCNIPGLFNDEQVQAWRRVTEAVHAKDSRIFVQLMHTGRVGHPLNLPAGARLLGPSAVAAPGSMFTLQQGMQPIPAPEAMTAEELERSIQAYTDAAALAVEAGFDGVELHGANGYLIDQFCNLASNHRDDDWGGSIAGRTRFALETARRVVERIGGTRVGFRMSPYGVFNGMSPENDPQHEELYAVLAKSLSKLGVVYVHVVDHSAMGAPQVPATVKAKIRENFRGAYILSGGYDAARAQAELDDNRGELVAFGRPFISNPRLVSKLRNGSPLREADPKTFYAPGPEGYIDYPEDE